MDKYTAQYLGIKYPDIQKEIIEAELKATAQVTTLAPVGKDKYIEVLATAGKGIHVDKIVEAVHGIKPGTPLFLPNKKRTATWLNQNSSETVRKGIAGVVEKVSVIDNKATPATYKLTDTAMKAHKASIAADGEAEDEGEEQTPPPAAKKSTGTRKTVNA